MSSPINSTTFTRSIEVIYNYLTSIGVHNKKADSFVTEELQLTKKPTKELQILQKIFGLIFSCYPTPKIPAVIKKIEACVITLQATLDISTVEKASFVISTLRIIQQKKDKDLADLSKINLLSHLTEHASLDDKSQYKKLEAKLRKAYKEALPFDPKNKVGVALKKLQTYPSRSWDTLPRDPTLKTFSYLGPIDLTQLQRVSKKWNAFAKEALPWLGAQSNKEHTLVFSSLRPNLPPCDAFKTSRSFALAIQTKKPPLQPIGNATQITGAYSYNLGRFSIIGNDLFSVLKDKDDGYILHGETVVIYRKPPIHTEVLDGENLYLVTSGAFQGISTYQVDTQNGENTLLWQKPDVHVSLTNVSNGKQYCILHDRSVVIYDIKTGKTLLSHNPIHLPAHPLDAILSGYYVTRAANGTIQILNLEDPTQMPVSIAEVRTYPQNMYAKSTILYVASLIGNIIAYCMQTGKKLAVYPAKSGQVDQIVVSDGILFAFTDSSTIKAFDIATTKLLKVIDVGYTECTTLNVHNKNLMYVNSRKGTLYSLDFT